MINYYPKTKQPDQFESGRFTTFIKFMVDDGTDEYGQTQQRPLFSTRCNMQVLESDDATNLERVVKITVYSRAIEQLLARQPEKCFIVVEGYIHQYVDIADVSMGTGVYSFISGRMVSVNA